MIQEHRQKTWDNKVTKLEEADGTLWQMAANLQARGAVEDLPLTTPNGILCSEKEKAQHAAEYLEGCFTTSVHPLAPDGPDPHPEDTNIDYPEEEPPQLHPDQLKAALAKLRRKKSPGEDGIPNEALLQMPTYLVSMLLALFTA
jgi:hypothetical protein